MNLVTSKQSALAPEIVRSRFKKVGRGQDYPLVCLFSGGLDSTTLIAYYINELGFHPQNIIGLFVDYGQDWHPHEETASLEMAEHLGIQWDTIAVPLNPLLKIDKNAKVVSYIPFRNIHLLGVACNYAVSRHIYTITTAARYGVYPDTTQEFFDRYNFMLQSGVFTEEAPYVEVPFVWWGYQKIFNLAKAYEIPTEKTRSCQRSPGNPCKECSKCKARMEFFGHW